MSVEKTISHEEMPYFQVYTDVIQNINNPLAGFIWVYLLSKPKDWSVIKEHLKNKFDLGDKKMKDIFAYLKSHQLIDYIVQKDEKGKIIKFETRVLNGSKFLTDEQVKELSTKHISTGSKIHPVVNHSNGKEGLHIIENTNKRKNTKNREKPLSKKSYCPGTHELIISDEAIEIAKEKNIDLIKTGYKFMHYAKENGWLREDWQGAFVKWLLDEKEIRIKNYANDIENVRKEAKSTVKFWEKGNPDYDRVNGITD